MRHVFRIQAEANKGLVAVGLFEARGDVLPVGLVGAGSYHARVEFAFVAPWNFKENCIGLTRVLVLVVS